ncbi:MAG: NAD-dependent epimerase/dehydratase family protein [Candidatus Thermoplasmatota archaeon]|nr:NAD-dependent epimerase/dehydratase family protein [Candidatus Thermoplasmatota archaeon]
MRFLVTGSSGFIGSNLVSLLRSKEIEVISVDNKEDDSVESDIRSIQWDLSGVDSVIHLAAKISVAESFEKKEEYHQVNVEATKRLFEACRDFRVNRVVFASSAAVYGQSMKKIKTVGEESDPESPYAENKIAGEELAMQMSSKNCTFTCFRFFNVFGPGQKYDSPYSAVIPIFIYRLSRGIPVTIYGDGEQTRDFIHISDVCNSLYKAAISNKNKSEILNLGTGKSVSILDLAKLISGIVSEEGGPRDTEIIMSPSRSGDVRHSTADIHGLDEFIGDSKFLDLSEGIRDLVRTEMANIRP